MKAPTNIGRYIGLTAIATSLGFGAMLVLPVVMFNPQGGNPMHYTLTVLLFGWALWAALVCLLRGKAFGKLFGVMAGAIVIYLLWWQVSCLLFSLTN